MSDTNIKVVTVPGVVPETAPPYRFNRPPLQPNRLAKLPLGSVRPTGWLRKQLELMAAGMTGRLDELSSFLKPDNGWFGGDNPGWEEQPYWLRGFYSLAVLTGKEELLREANRWLEAVIRRQDPDGYFGARCHKRIVNKNGQAVCDLWPQMVMLDALMEHHEYTSDPRVPELMARFFKFCAALPDEQFVPILPEGFDDWKPTIQRSRAGDMLAPIFWLYNQTGAPALLPLAERFFRHIAPPASEWLDPHIVNFTQRFRYFAEYGVHSRQPWHRAATEYWYHQHLATWGQQPRGIFGADEQVRSGYTDPRQAFETCGMVEFNKSFYILGRITGHSLYADRIEDLTLNHFPAAQTPDLKGLHYLTAANQPQLDKGAHDFYWNTEDMAMALYSPHERYRCCQHNVAMGWPWYVENLWQATPDQGLVAWLYAGCEVTAAVGPEQIRARIIEETDYPFAGRVQLTVQPERTLKFPLYLRIPGWCAELRVRVNREAMETVVQPGAYLRLERAWSAGDTVAVEMRLEAGLTVWPRNGSITVNRGPLSYSVKIGEQWQVCGGTDKWPEWEVLPTTPWNYGLALDPENPAPGLRIIEKGRIADQPWTVEAAPVEIKVKARRLPDWGLRIKQTVDPVPASPVHSREPLEEITLIPLGCARLRMACLPLVGRAPDSPG